MSKWHFGSYRNRFARRVAFFSLVMCGVVLCASPCLAKVLSSLNVTPVDNPLTPNVDEGIPEDGNYIDPDAVDPFLTYSTDSPIGVGVRDAGNVLMTGESQLRYGYLVLGGDIVDFAAAEMGEADLVGLRGGRGLMRIEGFGTVFNNDPWIQPYFPFVTVADDNRNPTTPYDIYVGLTGGGTLSINNGGRAEARDGVIVGYGPGASGLIEVNGLDSALSASGMLRDGRDTSTVDPEESTPIRLGTYGYGTLAIRDGGIVDALVGVAVGTFDASGEAGGSTSDIGGRGEVNMIGQGSLFRVLYSMSVGEYLEADSMYRTISGQGVVTIGVGSRITVDTIDVGGVTNSTEPQAEFRIGRFGQLNMDGGRLIVANRLDSDGLISGGGRIDVGFFNNRRLSDVRVGAAEKLLVVSNSNLVPIGNHGQDYYMANFGLVEVIGGEVEFDRSNESNDEVDMFLNYRREIATLTEPALRGHLFGQQAIMRFRSGLLNRGLMSFTAGDNVVEGPVINDGIDLMDPASAQGEIVVAGYQTTLTFQDLFTDRGGTITLAPESSVINFLGGFVLGGSGSVSFGLGGNDAEFSPRMNIVGDAFLNGELEVTLGNFPGAPFAPQAGDLFPVLSATGLRNGIFTSQLFPTLAPGLSWLPLYTPNGLTLLVTAFAPIGSDFNGDGIVDRDDLAIWQMNFGILMGANRLQGDRDDDGDVDGADFLLILNELGGPPVPGGGSGSGADASVPEPSSFVLLALAGLGAFGLRRRIRR